MTTTWTPVQTTAMFNWTADSTIVTADSTIYTADGAGVLYTVWTVVITSE
jgi:hypothetical protein